MGITREFWFEFAKRLMEKYSTEVKDTETGKTIKCGLISKNDFAREVAETFGGYSTWRTNEMKRSGDLYGYLFRFNDSHYAIVMPGMPTPKKKR